jgi:phospholipid transport system substrate-binding protein
MSQWVLGANWRRATAEQRDRFLTEFRDLLVNTYGYALLRYDNEQIQYLPSHGDPASGLVIVRTQIRQADGESIPVNYRLYHKHGEWKVFDLSIDGVSLISNYRNSFAEQIEQVGMDGLIKRLEQHNQQTTG